MSSRRRKKLVMDAGTFGNWESQEILMIDSDLFVLLAALDTLSRR
jgi:hypothetical protein